jgi:hypothetical protein
MRVLEEQQRVRNVSGPALLDKRTLQVDGLVISDSPEMTNVQWPQRYTCEGSNVSMPFFRSAMN